MYLDKPQDIFQSSQIYQIWYFSHIIYWLSIKIVGMVKSCLGALGHTVHFYGNMNTPTAVCLPGPGPVSHAHLHGWWKHGLIWEWVLVLSAPEEAGLQPCPDYPLLLFELCIIPLTWTFSLLTYPIQSLSPSQCLLVASHCILWRTGLQEKVWYSTILSPLHFRLSTTAQTQCLYRHMHACVGVFISKTHAKYKVLNWSMLTSMSVDNGTQAGKITGGRLCKNTKGWNKGKR